MRLIGIGLLAFLLTGVSLFLSNSKGLQDVFTNISEIVAGPNLQFEVSGPDSHGQDVVVTRAKIEEPIILSGLPAYKGATFFMPMDARPTSGYLQIDATIQVLVGVEGVLRVSIDSQRRGEMLLRPGEAGRSLRIQLTAQEIARERLVVSFSLQGEGPHAPCSTDDRIEAVVEIETTSAIFLITDAHLHSIRDQVLVAGGRAQVRWPNDQQAEALLYAMEATNAGVEIDFREDGLASDEIRKEFGRNRTNSPNSEYAWSDQLSPTSGLFELRRPNKPMSWRIDYDFHKALRRKTPKSLQLELELSQFSAEDAWSIVVTLNGKLVDQTRTSGGKLTRNIDLSSVQIRRKNTIEIQVFANDQIAQKCSRDPAAFAQIREETTMFPSENQYSDTLINLVDALDGEWSLSSAGLSTAEASLALDLLLLFPRNPEVQGSPYASIQLLGRGHDLSQALLDPRFKWLVFFDSNMTETSIALADYEFAETQHVTALVDLSGAAS